MRKNLFKTKVFAPLKINDTAGKIAKYKAGTRRRGKFLTGFTLWELMIAAAISIIAIGSLLITFMNWIALNDANSNLVIAANDAQSVLEEIKTLGLSDLDAYIPLQPANLEGENITVQISAVDTWVMEVTVNVAWNEKQRNKNFRLSACIAW